MKHRIYMHKTLTKVCNRLRLQLFLEILKFRIKVTTSP